MLKAYKYRIYPNKQQSAQIEQHFGACRLIWNLALAVKKEAWKSAKINVSRYDLQKQLIDLKERYSFLYDANAQSLQSVLLNLDNAFKKFFTGGGYPKFKSKHAEQSFQCPQKCSLTETLSIPKIKNIPIVISQQFIGKIKTVTISRTTTGKYFASMLVDDGNGLPIPITVNDNNAIGIDVGIKSFAVLSDGTEILNTKYLRNNLKRLKCLQRRVSRKKKGSKNRKKAAKRLALQHEKVANMRKDFLHKLTDAITKQYDTICVEDLAVKNMMRNHKLAQSISDVGWGEFYRQLNYKCLWRGKNLIKIGRYEASTKICSNCGAKNETITLADRNWTCAGCLTQHDRDFNAAKNIKKMGLKQYSGEGISAEPVDLLPKGRGKKQELSN